MEILTNSKRCHGAACILYPGVMEEMANKIVESKVQESILNAVRSFRDLGADDKRIQEILVKNKAAGRAGKVLGKTAVDIVINAVIEMTFLALTKAAMEAGKKGRKSYEKENI